MRDLTAEFTVRAWETDDGLPENSVLSIAQTPDGYIWMATFNGLVRFDGRRMREFNPVNTPELASSRIHRLGVDRRGRLWILSEFGDVAQYVGGRFRALAVRCNLGERGAIFLAEDRQGSVWAAGYGTGIDWCPLDNGTGEAPESPQIFVSRDRIMTDDDGTIWDNHRMSRSLAFVEKGGLRRVDVIPEGPEVKVHGLYKSPRGGIWICSGNQVHRLMEGKVVETRSVAVPIAGVGAMLEDEEGALWVGGWGDGLFRFPMQGEGTGFRLAAKGAQPPVCSLFIDREKNVWIGLASGGVRMLRPRVVQMFSPVDYDGTIRSVAEDGSGRIWVSTLEAVRSIPLPGESPFSEPSGYADLPWTLARDATGEIWVGSYRGGITHIKDARILENYPIDPLTREPYITTVLLHDAARTFWLGTSRGLFHLVEGKYTPEPFPGEGRQDVRALAEGARGILYAALNGRGLWRRDASGRWENFSVRDGLPDENVSALHLDESGALWIGTSAGGLACRRDGVIRNFLHSKIGLPTAISCILEDNLGFLWLGSNRGIYRVARRELEEIDAGQSAKASVFHYDRADGMNSSECVSGLHPSAIKAQDGRLWFSTARGVAMIDPARQLRNPVPPPVHIEEVWLDDHPLALAEAGRIPSGHGRLEFRYTGLSYSAPEKNRFRYRLEGWDSGWIEAGAERVARYMRVGPGSYTFRVQASNNEGVWNYEGAALPVVVLPAWWQSRSFRGLAVAALGGCVLLVHSLRVRWLEKARVAQEKFSRQLLHSQEMERKRIAGELHDSLGQNLLIIKNRALLSLQKHGEMGEVAGQFQDISATASRAVREVRELAHNLRPYQIDELGLSKGIQATVGLMLRSAGIEFIHQLDRIDGLLPSEFEINLFRIIQEAINNIVKHADANRVEISLRRMPGRVVLTVTDNGKGFNPLQTGNSFGLSGLMERARIMSGKCDIRSRPGAGTTIYLEIPCNSRETNATSFAG